MPGQQVEHQYEPDQSAQAEDEVLHQGEDESDYFHVCLRTQQDVAYRCIEPQQAEFFISSAAIVC